MPGINMSSGLKLGLRFHRPIFGECHHVNTARGNRSLINRILGHENPSSGSQLRPSIRELESSGDFPVRGNLPDWGKEMLIGIITRSVRRASVDIARAVA